MNAYCCICADLFENSVDTSIAAASCGHTFHELCLMQWIEKSSTCPTCRKQVKRNQGVKRLYFDIREDNEGKGDSARLSNQNANLMAQVSELTRDKKNLAEERDKLATSFAKSESVKESSLSQLRDLQNIFEIAQRELASKEKMIVSLNRELRDYVETQKKLEQLKNIKSLLIDSEQECAELTSCYSGGGEASIKQLVQMVAVVKGEYNKTLAKRKSLQQLAKELREENAACKEKLARKREEFRVLQRKAERTDEEVFAIERENNENRRKIAHLRAALKHDKKQGSESFVAAIAEDSPNVAFSPPATSGPSRNSDTIKSSPPRGTSPDLFEDSVMEDVCNTNEAPEEAIQVSPVSTVNKFPTATDKFKAAKQAKKEKEKDAPPSFPFCTYSIMQKKLNGDPMSRWGLGSGRAYNGFGGSVKIKPDEPLGPSKAALKKFAPKKLEKRKPLIPKSQVSNRPLSVEKLFRDINSISTKSSSQVVAEASGSSPKPLKSMLKKTSMSASMGNYLKRKSQLSISEMVENRAKDFVPSLAKYATKGTDFVDLTED